MSAAGHKSSRAFDGPLRECAAEGRLLLQRCRACGFVPNFPRIACPACLQELDWFEALGRGSVETFTVIRRPQHHDYDVHVPIVMALIALEEGAEMISTIVGDDRLETAIGAAVRVTHGWSTLPQFELVRAAEPASGAAPAPASGAAGA